MHIESSGRPAGAMLPWYRVRALSRCGVSSNNRFDLIVFVSSFVFHRSSCCDPLGKVVQMVSGSVRVKKDAMHANQ